MTSIEEYPTQADWGVLTAAQQIRLDVARAVMAWDCWDVTPGAEQQWAGEVAALVAPIAAYIETGIVAGPPAPAFQPAMVQNKALYQHACGHVSAGTDYDCDGCGLNDEWRLLYVAATTAEPAPPQPVDGAAATPAPGQDPYTSDTEGEYR